MKKYWMIALVGLLLLCAMQMVQRQQSIAAKLVRLHVVANSDSQMDQTLKLQVRDAVLAEVQQLSAGCTDKVQTVAALQENLDLLCQTAENALRDNGCSDQVHVTLYEERFPTRFYQTFTLPAGTYTSLRVELGEGAGRNWWCVAFPTLCTAAQQDLQAVAASYGFTADEIAMITEAGDYELDFKILEWLEKLKELFVSA